MACSPSVAVGGPAVTLVSAAYLCAAKAPSQELNPAYGYLWWNNANPGDGAGVGAGGQVVMIVPSLDLVVVRQGQNPGGAQALPGLLAAVCAAVKA